MMSSELSVTQSVNKYISSLDLGGRLDGSQDYRSFIDEILPVLRIYFRQIISFIYLNLLLIDILTLKKKQLEQKADAMSIDILSQST